jgi:hypothetical protein
MKTNIPISIPGLREFESKCEALRFFKGFTKSIPWVTYMKAGHEGHEVLGAFCRWIGMDVGDEAVYRPIKYRGYKNKSFQVRPKKGQEWLSIPIQKSIEKYQHASDLQVQA